MDRPQQTLTREQSIGALTITYETIIDSPMAQNGTTRVFAVFYIFISVVLAGIAIGAMVSAWTMVRLLFYRHFGATHTHTS